MVKWLGAAIGAVCLLMLSVTEVMATGPWVADGQRPLIVRDTPVDPDSLASCYGRYETVLIENVGWVQGCVVEGAIRTVTYQESNRSKLAVATAPIGTFFPLKGVCEQDASCAYAAASDRLVERSGPSEYAWQLTVYDDASRRITFDQDQRYYRFASGGGSVVGDSQGSPVAVGGFAMSHNGRWLTAELRNKGNVLIDLTSMTLRRVLAPGYQYDLGMDPDEHLAVSDDGRTVVVTGVNAGFRVISVDESCGDRPIVPINKTFHHSVTPCRSADAGIGATPHGFLRGYAPEFSSDTRVSLIVAGKTGTLRQVTLQPSWLPPVPSLEYLALGDSFSSGEGELDDRFYLPLTNIGNEKCHTSRRSYPFLIGIPEVKSVACSGARIHDVMTDEAYAGQYDRLKEADDRLALMDDALEQFIPGRIPQGDFVGWYTPKRLTIGIGGNDAGMMDKLRACTMPDECRWVGDEGLRQTVDEIDRLYLKLTGLYEALKEQSPRSDIYVMGYPKIISMVEQCDPLTQLLFTRGERRYMNEAVKRLNQVVAAAAGAAGLTYVDVEDAFTSTALCDGADEPSMNGFRFGREAGLFASLPMLHFIGSETFHPTPYGHELLADRLKAAMVGASGCCQLEQLPEAPDFWMSETGQTPVPTLNRQEMAASADDHDRERRLVLKPFSFGPRGKVTVELHSAKRLLAETTAGDDGSLGLSVVLPEDIEEGFHTIYAYGETDTGERVGYYQGIVYDRPEMAGQGHTGVKAETAYSKTPVARIATASESSAVPAVLSVAIEKPVNSPPPQVSDAKTTTESAVFSPNWFWLLPVSLLVGIMAVWLTFARRSKKSSRHPYSRKSNRSDTWPNRSS